MTDNELREYCKIQYKHFNGEYIEKICRNCKHVWFAEDAKTGEAKIIEKCKNCFGQDE